MDQFDENDIAKLLRLKKFEQPPPAYFENFLHEFHRRQRDELLREPLWRICLQRAHDFMFSLNVPSLTSYPAAVTAMLLIAAVVSLKIYQTPANVQIAHNSSAIATPVNVDAGWTLDSPAAARVLSRCNAGPTTSACSRYTTSRCLRAPNIMKRTRVLICW